MQPETPMMRRLRFSLLSMAALFFIGCAAQFAPPASGPIAKLRIKSGANVTYTWVHTYDKPDCQNPQWFGAIGDPGNVTVAHQPKGMLDSAAKPDPNVIEQLIPARQTTLLFTQHGPHSLPTVRSCKLAVNFDAKSGGEYEITYDYDATHCFANVELLKQDGSRVVRQPVTDARKHLGSCSPFVF
jgi:hypothetical protein